MSKVKHQRIVYVPDKNLKVVATVDADTNQLTLRASFETGQVANKFGESMSPKEYFSWLRRIGAIKRIGWSLTLLSVSFPPLKPGDGWVREFTDHVDNLD
jgi:hypothetical protein